MRKISSSDARRHDRAERPALERLYGDIGIQAVAAAARYREKPAPQPSSEMPADRFVEAA